MSRLLVVSLLFGALATAPGLFLAPAGAAPAGSRSLNLCVVEPGFAAAGDQFALHTQGPANVDEMATLTGSACGSYRGIPGGDYAITQSVSPPGWQLAQIRCFETGHANAAVGTVTSEAGSVALRVRVPTVCIFAELPTAASSSAPSGSQGNGSNTTTTEPNNGTTKPTTPASAPTGNRSLNLCVVEPGFAAAGDQFSLHTQGPANVDEMATLTGSACGSYRGIPAGDYAITQAASPPGWQLAQIRCFETGHANAAVGTVTGDAGSVALRVRVPTVCIFAELPTAASSSVPSGSRSTGGGTTHSTTTTKPKGTPKPPTPPPAPAPNPSPPNPNISFCKLHPDKCLG